MIVQWFATEDKSNRIIGFEWFQEEDSAFGTLSLMTRETPSDTWSPPHSLGRVLLRTARIMASEQALTVEERIES